MTQPTIQVITTFKTKDQPSILEAISSQFPQKQKPINQINKSIQNHNPQRQL